jgi:XRE family transcriptional regulator, fatty acid utilization regulator
VLRKALESDCGIKIFHEDFEPTGTAACVRSEALGMAVLLNNRNTPERRNFDLAHELFHLLVWDAKASAPVEFTEEQEEKLASSFASYLLLPPEVVRRIVNRRLDASGKLAVEEIPEVAQEFDVSVDALLWGMFRVYNLGDNRKDEVHGLIALFKPETVVESAPKPPKYPERYQALATRALNAGEMSVGKFMEYLEVSRRDALSRLRQEEEPLGEVQVVTC